MLVAHHRPATGLFVRTVQSALLVLGLASTAFGGALNPSYNWMTELVQPEAFYGASLANAGDVNGDGYDDVIVSASQYDSGSSGVGLVRVYYGSAAGLPVNQSWVKTGSAAGGEFGQVVAGAGDVNGDGYDDVVISSAGPLVCCYTRSGSVSLFLGSATGLATTAARTYSSGESAFNYFGDRLTGLGDVNGDGYGDFAAASRQYSNGQSSEGAIFVYYGAATPPSSASLIIEGNVASAQLGVVAAAGDVNGDGYADMLVRGASSTRLHYGSAAGLSATPAWQLGAPWITNFNSAWNPMASAGDVNNDGFADVLISDWLNSTNSRVHLFYGSASGLAAAPDYTFNGATGDGFGAGIAGIGDVDGDGYDDVIITAPAASNGQSGEGRAYLYRGSSSGLSTQIAWTGEPNNAGAGLSDVAGADVNHDGLADAILGAYSYANHGAAFVFHGTAATCTAPAAPSALTVSAPADNQLALSWPVVAGAHHSIIYRALAACGNGTMARIGETQSNVGTYVDTTPLPGGLYSYAVTSATAANTCESGPSNCDDETVTGTCSVKPTFAGVASVTESECGYLLSWSPAVSNCPAPRPIRYHVYRGGSSSFTVDSSNRIASCVDGSSYLTPVFGTGYYYVVRAEEGGCTAANEETNSLRLTGPPSLVDYFDDMEDPRTTTKDAYWSASGAIRTNCKVYSGTRAWRFSGAFLCNSYNAFEQNTLTLGGNGSVDPNINGFVIPQPWKATLTFQHYYSTVSGRDGAMLMYASDFPNNWNYVATAPAAGQPYYVSGAPNGTIRSGTVAAWTGTNNFFSQVTVNLDALAGHKVWFRWVWIADGSSSSNWGYYVDQVRISGQSTNLTAVSLATTGPKTFCWSGGGTVVTATPNGGGPPYVYNWGYRTTPGGPITYIPNFHQPNHTVYASNFGGEAGTYYLVSTVTPICGPPTVSAEMAFTITSGLPAPAVTAGGPTTFCSGGSVTLSAPAGFASYLWSNGATTPSIAVTQSGSYSVQVTDVSGCSATSAATVVTVQTAAPASITPTGSTTFCAGGSVTLTASDGASWLWSNGATTRSIAVSASGSFTVTVTDAANGCTATSAPVSVTVHALAVPVITASGPTTFCTGGSVTLTASAGASYLWSNGATTRSIEVTDAGDSTVTVTDANGCSAASAPVTVTVHERPAAAITASGATTFCAGGSVTLTASDGASWLWSNGATTQSIAVAATGSYTVTVTGANGCGATSPATVVTVNALPVASIAPSGPTTFCAGGSVTLTAPGAASWLWSNGATTQSIAVSESGSYGVTVTNASGCSATSDATTVTVEANPSTPAITPSGPTTFCEGGSVTLTAPEGFTYLWSTEATTQSIVVSASGSYSVTVTNGSGCSATSAATAVTVNANPSTPLITASGPTAFCEGGSVTLSAPDGFTYLWSNGATTQSIVVTASGAYAVTVTNGSGCPAASAATTVTVNANPSTPAITAGGPTTFCEGGSVTLSAPGGFTYLWSNGATTQSIAATASGSYSVTVTNASGCSATSAATTVTVNANPTATISASGPTAFCQGGSVTLTASAATSYLWSNGATTQSINVTTTGSYSVTVTNTSGCSATSAATTVTVNANPVATITVGGPTTFCAGGSVTLTASAGTSYLWSNGATTQSINATTTGPYSVKVTNASGCSATSAATAVTVNANPATPTITAGGPTTFCTGGSVTLTAPAGFTYLWSTGATTQSISATASGSYSVTVTNASGCSATSAATTVTVNAKPAATITAGGPTTFCTGGSVTLTAPAGNTYLWSTGATTASINVTTSGSYTVTVTNASGCSATSAATTVTVNAKPATPAITAGGPTTFCVGGSVTLTAPAGFTYLWSNGATTQSINATAAGNYSVTVTNASGCSSTSAATTVTVNAATSISAQPQSVTIARNATTTLSVTASGTGTLTYQWYRGTSPSTATPVSGATSSNYTTPRLSKGTYTYWVRVTGSCGVVNSNTATVSVP